MKYCLALLFATAVVVRSYDYSVSGTNTCTLRNATTGFCDQWTFSSSVTETNKCFPEDTIVITSTGNKQIKDLTNDDLMLSFNHQTNASEFTKFDGWLHFEKTKMYDFVEIVTDNGTLIASPLHNHIQLMIIHHQLNMIMQCMVQFIKNCLTALMEMQF